MSKAPVIISGMHRSGTSLFSSLMAEAGMHIGKDLEQNFESIFFYNINESLLETIGATWDAPKTLSNISEEQINDQLKMIDIQLKRKGTIRYLGIIKWIKTGIDISNLKVVWGWKDPRNTITWPIWKKKFVDAKIIHVVRNPIDVAISLQKREVYNKKIVEIEKGQGRIKTYSILAQTLEYCLSLWEQYEEEAARMIRTHPNDVFLVKYEDLLTQPYYCMGKVLDFINEKTLKITQSSIDRIDTRKAYAFLNNAEYKTAYESVKANKHVMRYGYDTLEFK
jgi:hypothetical protein